MIFLKIVIFLLLVLLVSYFFEKLLRKIANVEKRKGYIYKPVNKRHKVGQRIILILYFIGLIINGFSSTNFEFSTLMLIFLLVLFLHRAYMEWKYNKESREYIITFSGTVYMVVLFYIFIKFDISNMLF